jgi:outer membrane protein OmpA-like peptidoglycan-associated protein
MTNSICVAAEAASRTHPGVRFIKLAPVLLIAALVGACGTKGNTGATVSERSLGAGAQGTSADGSTSGDGATSTAGAAAGSQGGAGGRSSGTGSAAGGRAGNGAAGSERAQGDSLPYDDSEAEDDSDDEFTGIAGDDATGADGAGGTAAGAGPGRRSEGGSRGSSAASLGDDSGGAAGQDGTSAGAAAGGRRSAGGAGAGGGMAESAGGAAGSEAGVAGSTAAGAAGGAGGGRSGQGGAGADDAIGAGSDQEAMAVGMVDAPGSRVRIDEEVTPQTLGGMLPLAVGVDEEGHFDFDQAVLRPEVKSVLDELAVRLRDAEWDRLDVMGYTDRIGTDDYNQQLSERRAWAVARYLMAQGIPVNKMRVEGRGERSSQVAQSECHDLERAELIACLQKDRRVEIEASIRKTEAKIQ